MKKIFLFTAMLLCLWGYAQAQNTNTASDATTTQSSCILSSPINVFLTKNIVYPAEAIARKIQGKVFVQIDLRKDGSIIKKKVKLLRGIGGGCDQEAIRVIKNLPKEITKNFLPERKMVIPVQFSLKKSAE